MAKRSPRGTATVNFPYILKKTVVSDRRKTGGTETWNYREEGRAYHNGKWWKVYRTTRTGQWFSWGPEDD